MSIDTRLNTNREAREDSEEYMEGFCRINNVLPEKSLNAIFDQLLFVLRCLRELRGFFIEPIEKVYFLLAGICHPSYHVAQHFCKKG